MLDYERLNYLAMRHFSFFQWLETMLDAPDSPEDWDLQEPDDEELARMDECAEQLLLDLGV